jgi:transposase, IS5 family
MGRRDIPISLKKRKRRRSAVEPKIGHLKSENRMNCSYLAGFAGDQLNAILAGAGSNFRKILRRLRIFVRILWAMLKSWIYDYQKTPAFT